MSKIGKFSGNKRLDPKNLYEIEIDNDDTFDLWFNEIFNDEEFQEEILEIVEDRMKIYSTLADPKLIDVHIIGLSHLDVAYKWRFEQTIQKGIRTLAKAVKHCECFPNDFRFVTSTPQVFAWIKQYDFNLFEKIRKFVKSGQIELVGGAWVEPDCMTPCGEAFIRQRLYGMKFYYEEFNILPKIEWVPDSFGFNRGLPQILAKSGAECFFTYKMTWNQTNTFPFIFSRWQGPEGSELLSACLANKDKLVSRWDEFRPFLYALKKDAKKEWNYMDDLKKYTDSLDNNIPIPILSYFKGKGDGGHGPSYQEVAEMRSTIQAAKKSNYNYHWSSAESYFKEISKFKDDLPIWQDEMYLEEHRGTFSVHSEIKRHNRKFENLILGVETISTLISIFNRDFKYPSEKMEDLWKKLLILQFHDVLPGSCIPEVLDDCVDYWENIEQSSNEIINSWFETPSNNKNGKITLINPLSLSRNEPIFIPIDEISFKEQISLDSEGKPPYLKISFLRNNQEIVAIAQPVAAERSDNMDNHTAGWWVIIEIPSYGIINANYEIINHTIKEPISDLSSQSSQLKINLNPNPTLSNGIISLELDKKTGGITSLKSSSIGESVNLLSGNENNLAVGYEDDNPRYQAWNLKDEYWKYPKNYSQEIDVEFRIIDNGPIFITLQISRKLGISKINQQLRLFRESPLLHCLWEADWNEPQVCLKIGFETTTNADVSISDQMYCAVSRKTNPEFAMDKARYEKVMHKYADMSANDNKWGIAFLNEGKYAFATQGNHFDFTVHRSPEYPSASAESWALKERHVRKEMKAGEPPTYVGLGKTSCRYAIFSHINGTLLDQDKNASKIVKNTSECYNSPVIVKKGIISEKINCNFMKDGLDFILPENLMITAIKPNEWEVKDKKTSIILRIVEFCGVKSENIVIILPDCLKNRISNIQFVDFLDRKISEKIDWVQNSSTIKISFKRFEVKSLELFLK